MARNMKKPKTINLPSVPPIEQKEITLPYNGNAVSEKSLSFSFACFDRTHELFNLGDRTKQDGTVSGRWFLDLLDCLKSISNKNRSELYGGTYDLHPIDWNKANTSPPGLSSQLEYFQMRINKSKGRIIGFILDNVFYIVWLDPHHNLTDSEGYGKAMKHKAPLSEHETQTKRIAELEELLFESNKEVEELLMK